MIFQGFSSPLPERRDRPCEVIGEVFEDRDLLPTSGRWAETGPWKQDENTMDL